MEAKTAENDQTVQRLDSAIELADLSEHSVFALTSIPWPEAHFKTLFGGRDASLVRHFNDPPRLRPAGFSLEHDGNSRIVMGDLRRVVIPGWKIMELWRDGLLIYAVDALVQPFWGSPRQDGHMRLNPLALVEPIYLFADLTRLVYAESIEVPHKVEYRVRFERISWEGKAATLAEGPLDNTFFESGARHSAPAPVMDKSTIISWIHDIDPGIIAYQIIQEIYHWFGIADDKIPYTRRNESGSICIDREALISAGTR